MTFTTEDLRDFLTTYRGITDVHDAVRAFWTDLTEDHSGWLDNAPADVRKALEAYLSGGLVLDPPRRTVKAPFGDIALERLEEPREEGWFNSHLVVLRIGERLFRTGFYVDDGEVMFDGSHIQEVKMVQREVSRHLPDYEIGPFTTADNPEFTPNLRRREDKDLEAHCRNIVHAIQHNTNPDDPTDTRGVNNSYCQLHLVGGFIEDAEGNKITNYGDDVGVENPVEKKIVVHYRYLTFVITFPWNSYGGVEHEEVAVSPSFIEETVLVSEMVPVNYSEELVPMDFSYLDDPDWKPGVPSAD